MFRDIFCKNNRFLKDRHPLTICKAADLCSLKTLDFNLATHNPAAADFVAFVKHQVQCVVEEIFILMQGKADKIGHSFFTLHYKNNIKTLLSEIKNELKTNEIDIFCGAFFGVKNLQELALTSLNLQTKMIKGAYQMTMPGIDTQILGMLMSQAGFGDPSVLNLSYQLQFTSFKKMLSFTRELGGPVCVQGGFAKGVLPKSFFYNLEKEYIEKYKKLCITLDVNCFIAVV